MPMMLIQTRILLETEDHPCYTIAKNLAVLCICFKSSSDELRHLTGNILKITAFRLLLGYF